MIGCSAIQNPWFCKSKINRRVMGKQTCSANKRVTFTVIIERVNSLCQLLNLLGGKALYEVSIGLVTDVFFLLTYKFSYMVLEPFRAYSNECLLDLSCHPLSGRYQTTHNMLSHELSLSA